MMIPKNTNMKDLEEKGRLLYKQNKNYQSLSNVMEHPEFRNFIDQMTSDWDSVKTVLMFIKVYEAIEKHSNIELSPFQKISILDNVINDKNIRKEICERFLQWTEKKMIVE